EAPQRARGEFHPRTAGLLADLEAGARRGAEAGDGPDHPAARPLRGRDGGRARLRIPGAPRRFELSRRSGRPAGRSSVTAVRRALVRGARRLSLLRPQIAARERRGRLLANGGPHPPAAAVDGEPARRGASRAARPTVQPSPRTGRRDTPSVRARRVPALLAPDGPRSLRPFAHARRSQVPAAPPRELRLSVAGRNSPGDRRARLVRPAVLPSRDAIRKALLRREGRDDLAD